MMPACVIPARRNGRSFSSALGVAAARLRPAVVLLVLVTAALLRMGEPAGAQIDDRYLPLAFPPSKLRPQLAPRPEPRRRAPATTPAAPSAVVISDKPGANAVEPRIHVVVIGDTLAELLAGGLAEAFAEDPEVRILRRASSASGLVRTDYLDWRVNVRELLASGEKITYAVILLGSNDRQAMRDVGPEPLDPLSPPWKTAYAARIDEIGRAFAEKQIPVYWVGLPIMESPRFNADIAVLNELFRDGARRNGATFIDLFEPFSDAQNRYSATGPDINGDIVRLRTNDGVNFTKRGARKAAHFVEVEIRRAIEGRAPEVIAMPEAEPDPASQDVALKPGGVERAIDEVVRRNLDGLPPVPIVIPQRPVAGPILPLTVPEASTGGQLVTSAAKTRPTGDAGLLVERVIVQGRAPDPRPGRADDFRWPAKP